MMNRLPLTIAICFASLITSSRVNATTYYVDSVGGKDTNNGTLTSKAWKTLARVNCGPGTCDPALQHLYAPGDVIKFFAGGSWTGQLRIKGSGTLASPITIDMHPLPNVSPRRAPS